MTISNDTKASIASPNGRKILVELIEISHPDFDNPIRIAQYNQDFVHGGNTYLGWGVEDPNFFGDQIPGSLPTPILTLDNVNQDISAQIKGSIYSREKPTVIRKLVSVDTPEVIEREGTFYAVAFSYTAKKLVLTLSLLKYDIRAIPAGTISPGLFPASFGTIR